MNHDTAEPGSKPESVEPTAQQPVSVPAPAAGTSAPASLRPMAGHDTGEDDDEPAAPDPAAVAALAQAAEAGLAAAPALAVARFVDVVSGRFDAEEEDAEVVIGKRVLSPQPETPKLHKVLAQSGLGSRLEMEGLIAEGRITVNGEPAHIGQRVQYGDQIKLNGKPIRIRIDPPPARVIAYHKPVGEVVTHDDPQNRPTVFRKLPKLFQGKWQSVGRLDLNTEGLLLFTSSGELANQLMHPRFGLEREYAVRVLGALSNEEKQKLLDGVRLDDGMAQFGSIEDGGGEGSNCWYRVTISEGRNREVRRMLESVGHAVSRLIRIRYGAMVLPRGLKRGAWMELDDIDIQALMRAASGGRERPNDGERTQRGPDGEGGPRNKRSRNRRGGAGRGPGNAGNPVGGQPGNAEGAPQERQPDGNQMPRNGRRGPGQGQQGQGQQGQGRGQQQPRRPNPPQVNHDPDADFENEDRIIGPQPDPLKTSVQTGRRNPFVRGGAGGGGGTSDGQPDPMKTAFGYIGADSFTRQRQGPGGGQRRSGGGSGAGGGGGGGGQRRNNRGGGGGGGRGGNR